MQTDTALWQAIYAYDLDEASAVLPFSRRLARDNGWSRDFAHRAIAEYKRFIYLVCVSGSTLTPSEEVDSVWHLHLIYTRDYWDCFCGETLNRRIHHGPSQGGNVEGEKYLTGYRRALGLYEAEFGTPPPSDIWPIEAVRFASRTTRTTDTQTHIILPKRQVFLCGIGGNALILAACSPQALLNEAVPIAFAVVLASFMVICVVSAFSSVKRSGNRRDGSGCGAGCGTGGSDSGDGGSDSGGGDGGSGCGGGCGGGGD